MMSITTFASSADFPDVWSKRCLLDCPFFAEKATEFKREYGSSKPNGGTEHWRYAALFNWLRAKPDALMML